MFFLDAMNGNNQHTADQQAGDQSQKDKPSRKRKNRTSQETTQSRKKARKPAWRPAAPGRAGAGAGTAYGRICGRHAALIVFPRDALRGLRSILSDRMRRPPRSSGTIWRRKCPDGRPARAHQGGRRHARLGVGFQQDQARSGACIVITEIRAADSAAAQHRSSLTASSKASSVTRFVAGRSAGYGANRQGHI